MPACIILDRRWPPEDSLGGILKENERQTQHAVRKARLRNQKVTDFQECSDAVNMG